MAGDAGRIVDEITAQYGGAHRAVHAVGIGLHGSFTPTPAAAALSSAAIFAGDPVPVTARFSNGVGYPVLAALPPSDLDPDVRGMAVKFWLPGCDPVDGSMDMVAMTLDRFFDTVDTFQGFLAHTVADPTTGKVDYAALELWAHEHLGAASVLVAIQAIQALHDVSYGGVEFHGVNTFFYVDAAGTRSPGRFVWVPDHPMPPVASLPPDTPPDLLRRDLTARCRSGDGVGFSLQVVHPGPDDDLNRLSTPWTSTTPTADAGGGTIPPTVMGHLELGALVDQQYWDCEALAFNPTRLVPGVEVNPDDEIMAARRDAYAESHARRTAIYPRPSAIAK